MLFYALAALVAAVVAGPLQKRNTFAYGQQQVRGVNIGGWLVLEPWIKPSLFQQFVGKANPAVDEYTFCQNLGYAEAQRQLTAHWNSFYTENDFVIFKQQGLNHVRIPIGYWAFDVQPGEPWVQGAAEQLDKALGWASRQGLYVWIDLHGAPGSQNGFDNSGKKGPINWGDAATVDRTLRVLQTVTQRYGSNPIVQGIELLNEPAGFSIPVQTIKDFYARGYQITQSYNRVTVMQAAFVDYSQMTSTFGAGTGYNNIALDAHTYQIFSPGENARTHQQHVANACGNRASIGQANQKLWTITGEWTAAQNDCAYWLNGFGTGARYDGSFPDSYYIGSCAGQNTIASLTAQQKAETREFILAQLDAYETGSGWFFWAGKTESAELWDFQKLVYNGLMPQPLDQARGFCNPYPYSN
ncbi:hypothetical protein PYCC9005_002280 [Savitreella phatthalungensis]